MKSINLKTKYGSQAFYEAIKIAFDSGHIVNNMKAASNYAEWLLPFMATPQKYLKDNQN